MQLSIIIVSYNVKYFLEQCLCSVKAATQNIEAEIIVIDNCSTDNSIPYLKQKFPFVNFIINNANEGFGKANNKALQQAIGDYILFLNPDTIIAEDSLKSCLAFFETHKDACAIGVQMLDGNGNFLPESKRAFPSPLVSFFKLTGLSALFPSSSFFNRYALGALDKNNVHVVDVLSGAFMMAERKLLLHLNGFDESFFMYGEDIDLSYRIQQTGRKNYYLGNTSIIHFKGESAGKDKLKHTLMFYKAMYIFVNKHYKGMRAILLKLFLQAGIFIRSVISLAAIPFKVFANKNDNSQTKNIVLVGDNASVSEAQQILKKYNREPAECFATIEESKHTITKPTEVIFCTGTDGYNDAIKFMQNNKGNCTYQWHGLYTNSIVGSASKKHTGTVYFEEHEQHIH